MLAARPVAVAPEIRLSDDLAALREGDWRWPCCMYLDTSALTKLGDAPMQDLDRACPQPSVGKARDRDASPGSCRAHDVEPGSGA